MTLTPRTPIAPPRITITPVYADLEPGTPAIFSVEIFNASDIVEEFAIDVVGIDRKFNVSVEPSQVDLFPGTSATVEITVDVRTLYSAAAGEHKIGIRATPSTAPNDSQRTDEATVNVLPVSEVLLEAHPQMARVGRAGAFVLVARNRGNEDVEVRFAASDSEGALQFDFDPPGAEIPPGEEVYTVAQARGARPFIGQDAQRSVTFRTITPDPDAPEVLSDVIMMQRPWLASIFITLIVVVIAVALFAFAFLVVSRILRDEEKTAMTIIETASHLIA